ncbi:trehalose-6-phosphate synthase [Nocardia sp. NPDC088792]|uniref:alpha,alpha-trehalose-phosphate synthase (UDP-forming) n=1 Tax=Nocardia sp. NPDC088792 TaxID=3364332 RepID=UPI0038044FF5
MTSSRASASHGMHSLVIGYHRPPGIGSGATGREPSSPNGILPTLTGLFDQGLPGIWVAAAPGPNGCHAALPEGMPLSLLPLTAAEWSGYFHRACKETLWPILMSEPHRLRFDARAWAVYRSVNRRFAAHISARAAPGATVWLHDYNLWLVPAALRRLRPDLRSGLFHHTPFPPPEVFAALPVADEVRCSLAMLNWAGFHTDAFAGNFRRALGDRPGPPAVGIHPLGIDRTAVEALARNRAPRTTSTAHRLVLSVERLDYAKAPVQKVEAIADLLTRSPEYRGRLTFRLVCPPPEPGITAYDTTRDQLERRIAELNRVWRTGDWQPIDYIPRNLPFPDVIDHYLAADVFWVTSLQDGMNLTAKEFIAARWAAMMLGGAPAVLVLSRHTGAATALGDAAVLTDPHRPGDLAAALSRALALDPLEQRIRLRHLAMRLGDDRPLDWANRIIDAIRGRTPVPAG